MFDIRKNLAKNIRAMRGDITQREFAKKAGIAHPTVNRMEQGTENITINTIEKMCRSLKCTPEDLLGG